MEFDSKTRKSLPLPLQFIPLSVYRSTRRRGRTSTNPTKTNDTAGYLTSEKDTFAYVSAVERWPVILVRIIILY